MMMHRESNAATVIPANAAGGSSIAPNIGCGDAGIGNVLSSHQKIAATPVGSTRSLRAGSVDAAFANASILLTGITSVWLARLTLEKILRTAGHCRMIYLHLPIGYIHYTLRLCVFFSLKSLVDLE
jgi:hypothetical protein